MGTSRASAVDRPRVALLAVLLGTVLAGVACESGGDGTRAAERMFAAGAPRPDELDGEADHLLEPFAGGLSSLPDGALDDDAPLRRLEERVTTDVADAFRHDSWICVGETSRIEYRFAVDADGVRRGTELDGRGAPTAVTFGWAAIGADTLLLDYADVGRQVELGSILFAGDDALRANDGVAGPLECRRQRYVGGEPTRDVTVVAVGDVDRDAEAAVALAERVETRRVDGGAFAHWHCEVADGAATGYVFAGAGVLDPDPRAVTFDVGVSTEDAADGTTAGTADDESGGGVRDDRRAPVDGATLAGGQAFRWFAADGTTLLLVPLEANVASVDGGSGTRSLAGIVFPVDDAFTARRADGALLQCLRDGDP